MSEVVHTFTTTVPRWQPYVVPVDLATATEEQRAAMQATPSNKGISTYVLTLAHDPESLAVRSPLFNLIMYGQDGLASSERELGAVAASVVNRCVYCARRARLAFQQLDETDRRHQCRVRRRPRSRARRPPAGDLRLFSTAVDHAARGDRCRRADADRRRARRSGVPRPCSVLRHLRLGEPLDAYAWRADQGLRWSAEAAGARSSATSSRLSSYSCREQASAVLTLLFPRVRNGPRLCENLSGWRS
jgi:uncharacterized peroxidase-related enzyme